MAGKKTAETKVYIVETPVKDYCGVGAGGVHFAYGKAEVHEGWVLDWYKEHGYIVTEKAELEKKQLEAAEEKAE
jgi:hypothetical protein